jgi:hypothetical protein
LVVELLKSALVCWIQYKPKEVLMKYLLLIGCLITACSAQAFTEQELKDMRSMQIKIALVSASCSFISSTIATAAIVYYLSSREGR